MARPPLDRRKLDELLSGLHSFALDLQRAAPDYDALYLDWDAKVDAVGYFTQAEIDQAQGQDKALMLFWDDGVFALQQTLAHSPLIRERIRRGDFPPPPPPLGIDDDKVLETWFEDTLPDQQVTVHIRCASYGAPWQITVFVPTKGSITRKEVPMLPADQAGFARSADAHARGLAIARQALNLPTG